MIKAVFFDFYGTLAGWEPSGGEIQRRAAADEGVMADADAIERAYPTANALLDKENAAKPLRSRPEEERNAFFAEYERTLFATAGYDLPLETAARIWERVRTTQKGFELFPDARPALEALNEHGYTVGIVSNMGTELPEYLKGLGIADLVPVTVSSGEVGVAKPDPAVFRTALSKAGVSADEALHVGDGYDSDVVGARAAGIRPLFLLRDPDGEPPEDCETVRSLTDVLPYVQRNGG